MLSGDTLNLESRQQFSLRHQENFLLFAEIFVLVPKMPFKKSYSYMTDLRQGHLLIWFCW